MAVHPGIMAATLGPAVPFGYDSGLEDHSNSFFDDPLPSLEELQEMTAEDHNGNAVHYEDQMLGVDFTTSYSNHPFESSNMRGQSLSATGSNLAASNMLTSPSGGRTTSHPTNVQSIARPVVETFAGGSSLSPGTTNSLILTPPSTNRDYAASISGSNHPDEEFTDDNLSPTSTNQTDSDYVHVSRSQFNVARRQRRSQMSNNRPPHSSSGASGVSDAQHHSRASSVAPSTASFSGARWGSFPSTSSSFMDHGHQPHGSQSQAELLAISASYIPDDNVFVPSTQSYDDDLLSDLSPFDTSMFNNSLPFRPTEGQQLYNPHYAQAQPQHHQPNPFVQYQRPFQYYTQQQVAWRPPTGTSLPPQLHIPSTSSLLVPQQMDLTTAPPNIEQSRMTPSPMRTDSDTARRPSAVASARSSPYPRPTAPPASTAQQKRQQQAPAKVTQQAPSPPGPANKRLLKPTPTTVPSNDPQSSQSKHAGRGGRQKHSHLAPSARQKSHKMRKLAACWRCALQRDPCDEGTPCGRCMMKSQKGQQYFFDCDRSKLPDFVHDFLPPQASMTLMHQKQTIEDCVNDQVLEWDLQSPLDVYLTSGYGPALRWKLYEFKPRTDELLGQFQYLQDPTTGVSRRFQKYSPPFGLIKLDSADDMHFENYLESLLSPEYLWDLGWTCFEEESQVDSDAFQARLMDLVCKLYTETHDYDLKQLLKEIIRMMVITYIMGHTLTILEETLPSVLSSVKHSQAGQRLPHTSPRLANRQLKFFFAILRTNIYERILRWQQQTLHTSGKKEESWLPAFCATLGFAMVLEEVQRTIQIQADAKAAKGEMTFDQANTEASNACERIDARYKLLVGLFQCKYRDKKWGDNGSFGPQTPEFKDRTTKSFLKQLRGLTEEKQQHLQSRKDVQFAPEYQCRYTSRLVARFLLPFLSLPRS